MDVITEKTDTQNEDSQCYPSSKRTSRIAHLEVLLLWHNVPFCGIGFHLVLFLRSNVKLAFHSQEVFLTPGEGGGDLMCEDEITDTSPLVVKELRVIQ